MSERMLLHVAIRQEVLALLRAQADVIDHLALGLGIGLSPDEVAKVMRQVAAKFREMANDWDG